MGIHIFEAQAASTSDSRAHGQNSASGATGEGGAEGRKGRAFECYSNAGLRVVKSNGECESVWGPRRKDGVKMRDTLVGLGGRCDLIPPGAHVEEAVEGLWLI